jgi:hypothetical protein
VFASPGWLESQAVRVQIEPLSLAPQKRAQGPFPGSLAARGARIPRLGSFGLLAWLRFRAATPVFASPGWLGSQAVRVQIEPLSLAPQKRAQGPFPGSLAARGARIPRLGSFGLLAWLHIG